MKLNCLIVDDEPLARKGMEEYVKEAPFLELVGASENALKASAVLKDVPVDLMLLDIQMPKLSGIDFLKTLKNPPLIIFTTAYPQYALESYELDVIDYLVKPIPFERFLKAAQKAFDYYTLKQKKETSASATFFFIKCDHKYEKINYADVLYVEAMQNYCILHVPGRKLISYITLSGLQEQLPPNQFLKVHKSFIVAVQQITAIEDGQLVIGNVRIPISRNLREEVMNRIMGGNLFKR
jgi:DNA-binding LytR/AlgR family response regulator